MNLAELKEAYKARKLALDSAKKEEEKYEKTDHIYFIMHDKLQPCSL